MHLPFKDCLLLWSCLWKLMSDWWGGILLGSCCSWTQTCFINHKWAELGGRAVHSHHLVRADLQWALGLRTLESCATSVCETVADSAENRLNCVQHMKKHYHSWRGGIYSTEQKFRLRKWSMRVMKDRIRAKWLWVASDSWKEQEGWVCCRFESCCFDLFRPGKYHL